MKLSRLINAMKEVFLLLGSNIGDTKQYLDTARQHLLEEVGTLSRISAIYRTKAWGIEDQPDYLNQVMALMSPYPPLEILARILAIEMKMGRHRLVKWGSRTIDIDILYYGDDIIDHPDLKIPHPYLQARNFALAPLAEVAPDFIHPVLHCSNAELLLQSKDPLPVERLD